METQETGQQRDWSQLIALLEKHDSFIFSTHLEPDADGLGSELGLARYLKARGKTVRIINPSTLRTNLHFMVSDEEVEVFDSEVHSDVFGNAEVFIAFDIGHYNRLMEMCSLLDNTSLLKISIDHHPGDKSQFDHIFDDPGASSTGILIYDLLQTMEPEAHVDYNIALPIYAAMMSDTGNFRFNNTDPETLHAAASLVGAGVKPYELYVELYENLNTPSRLIVIQKLLETIQYDCEGRLAYSVLDLEPLSQAGVQNGDLHSLSDFIRSIKGVEIGMSITRAPGQAIDVSLRSKGHIPVNTIAQHFDGGGHAFAAGCKIDMELHQGAAALLVQAKRAIRIWDEEQGRA